MRPPRADAGLAVAAAAIRADWPAPAGVRACTTTRMAAAGAAADEGFDLSRREGAAGCRRNRAILRAALALPDEPMWLRQVHGTRVVYANDAAAGVRADAAIAGRDGRVLAVLTADCLPVAFCDTAGPRIGIAHAGWRGLAGGVLENTVHALCDSGATAGSLLAWLGPAIGARAFEVGAEVREAFLDTDPESAPAFVATRPGHWLADLYALARRRLLAAGLPRVYGGGWCTHTDARRFFSYRRDAARARMATLIWVEREAHAAREA